MAASCKVRLMKTVGSLSAAVKEEEEEKEEQEEFEANSGSSGEKKQLTQRRETVETSAAASAPATEEGTSCTTESLLLGAQAIQARRARSDGSNVETVPAVEDSFPGSACVKKGSDCREEISPTSFSRKSTAAFTSRGNTCRFAGSPPAGVAEELCRGEGTSATSPEQGSEVTRNVDGPETAAKRAAASRQRQDDAACTDATASACHWGRRRSWAEAEWEEETPRKGAEKGRYPAEEDGGGDYSIWRTPDQGVRAAPAQPVQEVVCREQHSVEATSHSPTEGATLLTSHSRSCESSSFAALPASFRRSGSQLAALPQKECAGRSGEDLAVDTVDIRQDRCLAAQTQKNVDVDEKSTSSAECWQIKRSASDGPSAGFGIWRTDDFFRCSTPTESDRNLSQQGTALAEGQVLPATNFFQNQCSSRVSTIENLIAGRVGCSKWDHPPRSTAPGTPHWGALSRSDCRAYESPQWDEIHSIRSLPTWPRGISEGREWRGKGEGEILSGGPFGTGKLCARNSTLLTESALRAALTKDSVFSSGGAEQGRNERDSSRPGTETAMQAASAVSLGRKSMCPRGRPSILAGEESRSTSKDNNVWATPVGAGETGSDDTPSSLRAPRNYASCSTVRPSGEGWRRVSQGNRAERSDSHIRCEDDGGKADDIVRWDDRIGTRRGHAGEGGDWEAVESSGALFSRLPSGTNWEVAKAHFPGTRPGRDTSRFDGCSKGAGVYPERGEAPATRRREGPPEEGEGSRLVRELVEEFDKRRTNFSILVPKVLELVGVLMGRPAGAQLPCTFPRNFSPATSLLRPCPLPVCASFSEMGQACTVEKLERYFPTFNVEGGLLLCTQGRRLESGGGGKYYFQDSRGHVIGCHKKHLARYDAQGRVASPVLLKTLLFCLVLRQVSRTKYAILEQEGTQMFKLPAAATAGVGAASHASPGLLPSEVSISSCGSERPADCEQPQDARREEGGGGGGVAAEAHAWRPESSSSPLGSPGLLRSLLDPLPPADALLSQAQATTMQVGSGAVGGAAGAAKRPHELGSTSTSTSSSRGAPTALEDLECATAKRKTAEAQDLGGLKNAPPLLQGAKRTRRSGSCTSLSLSTQNVEESSATASAGRLRRAVSTSLAAFAKTHSSSAEQTPHRPSPPVTPTASLRSSPTAKREAEVWESSADMSTSTRDSKPGECQSSRTGSSTNAAEREQLPAAALLRLQQSAGQEDEGSEKSRAQPASTEPPRWRQEEEGDAQKSAGTTSPALSPAASSASLASSPFNGTTPWWGGREAHYKKLGKLGTLSVVRSSNPQRLVRVYRSLVMEDKTHVVERLLRVWSMTLHARTSQSQYPAEKDSRRSYSPSAQDVNAAKQLSARESGARSAAGTLAGRRSPDEEVEEEKHLSGGEGATEEEQEESETPHTQEVDILALDAEDAASEVQCAENRRGGGGLLCAGYVGIGKAAQIGRGAERTTGTPMPQTLLLRKSNTTECGRVLRSGRTVERSLEGLMAGGREDRRRQTYYEGGGADAANNARRLSRLRRASTSARGELRVERHLTRYNRGAEEAAQDHLMRTNTFGRVSPPCSHFFDQPSLSKKRADAEKSADPSSLGADCEEVGEGDAFLWRPCMSVLWVKPLTVEQTMLKWSKSTPLFEPMEELAADRRNRRAATPTPLCEEEANSTELPAAAVSLLRSAPDKAEIFSTPTKTAYIGKSDGKKLSVSNTCSPESVRSEPSTSADCASSLPTSPLFAHASVRPGTGKIDQLPQMQEDTMLTRLQAAPQAGDSSPASVALLQAIQQQILQLLQPAAAGPPERTPHSGGLPSDTVQQRTPKANKSSITCAEAGSGDTSVYSKELSLALRLENAGDGRRRSSAVVAASEFSSASASLGDDVARCPDPGDPTAQHPGYQRISQLSAAKSKGREVSGTATATSDSPSSSCRSAGLHPVPHPAARETAFTKQSGAVPTRDMMGGCPVGAADAKHESARCIRTFGTLEDTDRRGPECSPAPNYGKSCGEAPQPCGQPHPPVPPEKVADGEQPERTRGTEDGEQMTAAPSAGSGRQRYDRERGQSGPSEEELRVAAQPGAPGLRATAFQKGPEPRSQYGAPPTPRQEGPPSLSKAIERPSGVAVTAGAPKNAAPLNSTSSGSDLDPLGLVFRLLGLSVRADSNEDSTRTQDLKSATQTALAAQAAHTLATLLSCHGDASQQSKPPDMTTGSEPSPSVVLPQREDSALSADDDVDFSRRSGQSSRKRGLETVEVQKHDEGGTDCWNKAGGSHATVSARTDTGEKTSDPAKERLQQPYTGDGKKISPFVQRQKKKTRWTALQGEELPLGNADARVPAGGPSSSAHVRVLDCNSGSLTGGATDDTRKSDERLSTNTAPRGQRSAHEGLLDLLFTQVLQQTTSPAGPPVKDRGE